MEHLNKILSLSTADKLLLMEKIWESIDPKQLPVSDAQKKELDRRLEKFEKGEMKFSSWAEVRSRVRS